MNNPTSQNAVQITQSDLVAQAESVDGLVRSMTRSVTPQVNEHDASAALKSLSRRNEKVSIKNLIASVDSSDDLPSDAQLHTERAIRNALRMGRYIAYNYRERAGVPDSAAGLPDTLKAEIHEKQQTAAAVGAFVTAQYLLWDMSSLVSNNTFLETLNVTVDEVDLERPMAALGCATFYLAKNIERLVEGSDERLVATVFHYAENLREEIVGRLSSLKHLEAFTQITYLLEDTHFSISGFEVVDFNNTTSVEFNRVEMGDIVGNQDGKHFASRLADRMLCYNRNEGRNVFTELGGLSPVWMGYGKPGTGKSMLIAAIATILKDRCDHLAIPFLFNPLPDNIIDSYQGNSAKNMVAWMKAAQDPSSLIFMPIDDAENILEERTRQGVSEGVRAAVGVFLRYTEGAYAINRGNATIGVFTNLPEQIDAAVRSRIQARMVINGANSVEDYLDQDYLHYEKFADQEGFVNLKAPSDYEYMSAQAKIKSMAEASQTSDVPEHNTVRTIFDGVVRDYDPMSSDFFARLYMAFMNRFDAFSSRDVRNINSAIDQRIMDFDLPKEWFETPEAFIDLEYDRQKEMVIELRNENMQGLSFGELKLQEAVRYLDNYARIADAQFDREVEARVKEFRINQTVKERLKLVA